MRALLLASCAMLCGAAAPLRSTPDLGKAEGQCRRNEPGPAFEVTVVGLKDRKGLLKLELYPDNDTDFLADDNVLLEQGKAFARVEMRVPQRGPVEMCIRAPRPGGYSLSLLHDRDMNRKFGVSSDGIGFPNDPKLGWSRPKAAAARALVGSGVSRLRIRLNYRHGLFSFGPIDR
ncbi:DUF2141 domain-containing protein [Sphingomonas sp. ID1715]|uniref:DUF2141 domain-containing protein n=1 Tax=Sphingomonas sp. ID1715 TaxID=1656898 RepID=UPI0014893A58|nr:DUF2141 domain-containing protein [Sphingomonas sp. ID1715]NNM77725.1 DUF2141 domain-containing protein [Sphingomonas sp. ID1715]